MEICSHIQPGRCVKKIGEHWFRARLMTPSQFEQLLAPSLTRPHSLPAAVCVIEKNLHQENPLTLSSDGRSDDHGHSHLASDRTRWLHTLRRRQSQRRWTSQSNTTGQFVRAWTDVSTAGPVVEEDDHRADIFQSQSASYLSVQSVNPHTLSSSGDRLKQGVSARKYYLPTLWNICWVLKLMWHCFKSNCLFIITTEYNSLNSLIVEHH